MPSSVALLRSSFPFGTRVPNGKDELLLPLVPLLPLLPLLPLPLSLFPLAWAFFNLKGKALLRILAFCQKLPSVKSCQSRAGEGRARVRL